MDPWSPWLVCGRAQCGGPPLVGWHWMKTCLAKICWFLPLALQVSVFWGTGATHSGLEGNDLAWFSVRTSRLHGPDGASGRDRGPSPCTAY